MIPRTVLICSVFAASVAAAPVPKELKHKSDAERIRGAWVVEGGGTRWYFAGEKLFAGGANTTDNKGMEYGVVLRTDGAIREIDLSRGEITHRGIYKFVDDDIHIAYLAGDQRPADFEHGTRHVLKRVAEVKK